MNDQKLAQAMTSELKRGVTKTVMPSSPNKETSNCSRTGYFLGKQMQTLDALGTETASVGVTWGFALFKTPLALCILFIVNSVKFDIDSLPQFVLTCLLKNNNDIFYG